jgi:hypothetical protein
MTRLRRTVEKRMIRVFEKHGGSRFIVLRSAEKPLISYRRKRTV